MKTPCLLLALLALGFAERIEVSPRDGEAVVQAALDRAHEGDEIRLEPGVYREMIRISKGVHLFSDGEAILDPSLPWTGEIVPAPEIGPNVFKSRAPDEVRGVLVEGRFLAGLDEKRTRVDGPWSGSNLLASGLPRSGWDLIRGLYQWNRESGLLFLNLGKTDPSSVSLRWVESKESVVTFLGARNATLRGLTLRGGRRGVSFREASTGCEIRDCRIESFELHGIEIGEGSSSNLVASTRITRGSLESWAPREFEGAAGKREYEVWQLHKNAGFYDRMGIHLYRAGAGNRILSNRIRETFDGINVGDPSVESLSIPLLDPDHGRGAEIAWNLVEDVRDSGMEIGAGAVDVRVHHNLLRRTYAGLRFKLPRIGPVFIHHNWFIDNVTFHVWFSMDSSPAEGYVYRNTMLGRPAALIHASLNAKFDPSGTPRWHLVDNLVISSNGLFFDWTKGKLPVNFRSSGNLVVGGGRPEGDEGSRFVASVPLRSDGSLADPSFLNGATARIPVLRDGNPLPGTSSDEGIGAGPLPRFFTEK